VKREWFMNHKKGKDKGKAIPLHTLPGTANSTYSILFWPKYNPKKFLS
jgi:hypothetical protein